MVNVIDPFPTETRIGCVISPEEINAFNAVPIQDESGPAQLSPPAFGNPDYTSDVANDRIFIKVTDEIDYSF